MVDWLVDTCMETKDDLYYGVCPREVMEKRFPDSKRTYTKLKDIELCGADINITHVRMATEHLGFVGITDRLTQESAQAGKHDRVGIPFPGVNTQYHA